jgi:hypothetical protein
MMDQICVVSSAFLDWIAPAWSDNDSKKVFTVSTYMTTENTKGFHDRAGMAVGYGSDSPTTANSKRTFIKFFAACHHGG